MLYVLYVRVRACLFVCYKKESITFDQNNATFTQKIDDCMGQVINLIRLKMVQNYEKFITSVLNFLDLNKLI